MMREDMISVECYYTGRLFYINSNHITTIKPLFNENDDTDLVGSEPTVDAKPIIRCKNCKYSRDDYPNYGTIFCTYFDVNTSRSLGYCYRAKQKEE